MSTTFTEKIGLYERWCGGTFTEITFKNPIKKNNTYTEYFKILDFLYENHSKYKITRKNIQKYVLNNTGRGYYSCLFTDLTGCSLIDYSFNNYHLSEQGLRYVKFYRNQVAA
jgi:hypothetical protein